MFITQQVEIQYYNHHDEAIDADLAIWITDLIGSFPQNLLMTVFAFGFIIILIVSVWIISLSRSKKHRVP